MTSQTSKSKKPEQDKVSALIIGTGDSVGSFHVFEKYIYLNMAEEEPDVVLLIIFRSQNGG